MTNQYRRLAVFVDRPSPGKFIWIVLESTDDPAVWLDLETGDEIYDNWRAANDAGNEALMTYIDDERDGPTNTLPEGSDAG